MQDSLSITFTVGVGSDIDVAIRTVVVDDSDAIIICSEGWIEAGATAEYMGTTHGHAKAGFGGCRLVILWYANDLLYNDWYNLPLTHCCSSLTRDRCDCIR